ncbi:pyruvate kinase [Candidatus Nomurabacteria bacterium]|nr:pyruvate kinase [Candidatus Nomurabacteria bacterium]
MSRVVFKRTKILATVGPSTNSYEAIESMIEEGVNGFRLNFSHGTYDERSQQIAWIRQASARAGKPVAILQDLQGPKIRLGEIKNNSYIVNRGDELILEYGAEHNEKTIPVQYNLADKAKPGQSIYIFDGKIHTKVTEVVSENAIKVRVENGGELMSKKGINLPDTDFAGDIITEKDRRDIEYGLDKDIDFVALSFVQSAEDIEQLRQMLVAGGSTAQIVSKVETKAAVESNTLEEIVRVSDGVMVARGDLAVEVGPEMVPVLQRKIIALCRKYGKVSIVATQLMASMVHSPEPTRAEVSDVATAVILGADTVMLSDETANGSFPMEAIATMKRTIVYTQEHTTLDGLKDVLTGGRQTQSTAISAAVIELAKRVDAAAIVAETKSGATADNIAAFRPSLPIISVTSVPRVAQQLALTYANKSFVRPDGERAGLKLAKEIHEAGFLDTTNDPTRVVIVSGRQPGLIGATDTIRVRMLDIDHPQTDQN